MIKHISDASLYIFLIRYGNWENSFPTSWKNLIIIPLANPGKDHTIASNYRPVALTSNLYTVMEIMIIIQLNYAIERKNLLSSYQMAEIQWTQ